MCFLYFGRCDQFGAGSPWCPAARSSSLVVARVCFASTSHIARIYGCASGIIIQRSQKVMVGICSVDRRVLLKKSNVDDITRERSRRAQITHRSQKEEKVRRLKVKSGWRVWVAWLIFLSFLPSCLPSCLPSFLPSFLFFLTDRSLVCTSGECDNDSSRRLTLTSWSCICWSIVFQDTKYEKDTA